ncbi:hypothetical protein A8C75_21970 [Marinobacterium aestuarii]|uniref:Restriction endonuclease n=1 Tax=Marinobacterium aestuarii TaxID=1821621 RepID=A0A1A9F3J0_9GAMM|nr:hypothetical protein [Marinobacterium aestuarii]ANG64884.1 hypothetical protein A8C75_21970 [Marinobacterium aestuarii]
MPLDLTQDETLKQALQAIEPRKKNPKWLAALDEFLPYVQQADLATRSSREFHQKLWEDNPVSGVGMGTVDITSALDDAGFRQWLAEASLAPLPETVEERVSHFKNLHNELATRLKDFSSRTPWVKIFRVLAAFFPRYFSTITYSRMSLECHKALFGPQGSRDSIVVQAELMIRLEQILGVCQDDFGELAERMTLPWYLYETHVYAASRDKETETTSQQGGIQLKPLPAMQRRKGFTSIRGGIATLLSAISFVETGVSREELMDHLRAEFPDLKESSLRTTINVLKNEFYVIQEKDNSFTPTTRGEVFLASNDPQELIPLIITRTLGVDHLLKLLQEDPSPSSELVLRLQQVNPGWTSDFGPRVILKWLKDFDLLQADSLGVYSLTEAGRSWAEQIDWEPESLPRNDAEEVPETLSPSVTLDIGALDQAALLEGVTGKTAFSRHIVSQLHIGLWAHPRRHFAILAGLSGSGKTLLAKRYGEALAAQYSETPSQNLFIQAVQPGWYDPTPLLGYINPLQPDTYVRPPLLDFLLRAAQHPDQPFTVILDEMNLSHPEQYFAPVLSAMESGDQLRLHNEGDAFDGVPDTIAYPANVAFVGTVNMDETTHGLSDKVLDRAFTLEFWDIDLTSYPNWGGHGLGVDQVKHTQDCLQALAEVLSPMRLHFGWRTVEDVLTYLALASKNNGYGFAVMLDDVIYARVLPKLRGSESARLHDTLQRTMAVLEEHGLSRSRAKVASLRNDLAESGMMRFWR